MGTYSTESHISNKSQAACTTKQLILLLLVALCGLEMLPHFLMDSHVEGPVDQGLRGHQHVTVSMDSLGATHGLEQQQGHRKDGYIGPKKVIPFDPLLSQIPSELHLTEDMKVFVFKPDDWVAAQAPETGLYYYMIDGIGEHPHIHLTSTIEEADVCLHLVLHTNITAYEGWRDVRKNPLFREKLVVIDENDWYTNSFHGLFDDYYHLAFFKRSFVPKEKGEPKGIDRASGNRDLPYTTWPMKHNYLPFAYGLARRYISSLWDEHDVMAFDEGSTRDIPVLCTLREYHKPAWPGGRENVYTWLTKMNVSGEIEGSLLGEVDDWIQGNRDKSSPNYTGAMKRAKIVVTANPGDWEGDFRLWEAMASKALVFVDYMYMPVPHMFQDGVDVIYFDYNDEQGFVDKIRYYLSHPEEARAIAMRGYYTAITHHRYVNRVDYVFNTVRHLRDPAYQESGMAMKEIMMRAPNHPFRQDPRLPP